MGYESRVAASTALPSATEPDTIPPKQSADVGRFLSHPPIRFDKGTGFQSSVRVSKAWSTLEDNIPGIPAFFFNEDARLLRVRGTDLKRKERRLMVGSSLSG